jgi:DNA/RNA-binding domain of Phe-tRNA-synthetase-like protein
MFCVTPSIDPKIAALAPGFRALSIAVTAAPVENPDVGQQALNYACAAVTNGGAPWAQAHLTAWDEVFKAFGAKPKRTPCSAAALLKRVQRDGSLPAIDPVVDLYNAISIEYAIPVGGENMAAYEGEPRLKIANGTELFDTVKEGELAHELPDPGEVVWCDDKGVTCRRWNWRQGVRTRLCADDERMWFILESLPEMPLDALQEAGDRLCEGLMRMMPGASISKTLIGVQA